MTVAFEIRYPWWRTSALILGPKGKSARYHDPFITIWHVDPERDGSDDSCGWFAPKGATAKEEEVIRDLLRDEGGDFAYYFKQPTHRHSAKYDYPEVRPGDCLALVYGIFSLFAARLEGRYQLTAREIDEAFRLSSNPHDNFQSGFAAKDDRDRERTMYALLKNWKRIHRRWWQHPRWHLHHWKLQVHPLQSFKRWAFTRCAVCGGRFGWGASGVSNSWNAEGPRWFRSERGLSHMACSGSGAVQVQEAT